MKRDEIMEALRQRPEPIDAQRWADMDPMVRQRFHEMGNHQQRLEGLIAALVLLVPERPETVPMLEERVHVLQRGADRTEGKVDQLNTKLDTKVGELGQKIDDKVEGVNQKIDTKFEELRSTITVLAVRVAVIGAVVVAAGVGGAKAAGIG